MNPTPLDTTIEFQIRTIKDLIAFKQKELEVLEARLAELQGSNPPQ